MKAFKCDRCGEYYSKSTKNYKYQVGEYDEKHKLYMYDDLCDSCLAELNDWMEGLDAKKGKCSNCEFSARTQFEEPCKNCTNAYASNFKPKK